MADSSDPFREALPWIPAAMAAVAGVFGYGRLSARVQALEEARKEDRKAAEASRHDLRDHIDKRLDGIDKRLDTITANLLSGGGGR